MTVVAGESIIVENRDGDNHEHSPPLTSSRIELDESADVVEYYFDQGWRNGLPVVLPRPKGYAASSARISPRRGHRDLPALDLSCSKTALGRVDQEGL